MPVRIKICGLTESRSLAVALEAGADAIGLVFASSPRQVGLEQAARLLEEIPEQVSKVAVFRTPDPEVLAQVLELPFDVIQAHAGWQGASRLPSAVRFMPSVADGEALLPRVIEAMQRLPAASPVHVDAPGGGGTGRLVDFSRVAAVAWRYPVMLAGGLTPANVAAAIASVHPVGVDVSSGVETGRGVKDQRLIKDFIGAAREACRDLNADGGSEGMHRWQQ